MSNLNNEFDYFEGLTSISAVIKSIKCGSSDRIIYKILCDNDRLNRKLNEFKFLSHAALELGFELISTTSSEIDQLTLGNTHGGFVAVCSKRKFSSLNVNYLTSKSCFALIDGLEDPYNFGYSVRSLYASGVDGLILPQRNWMELSGAVARSSAGTSELANIYISDPFEAVSLFKNNGFQIVCAEIRNSVSIYDYDFTKPVLLVIGGEKRGIHRKLLDLADSNVRIDYGRDFLGSLPTASAVSVIAFEILRQRSQGFKLTK